MNTGTARVLKRTAERKAAGLIPVYSAPPAPKLAPAPALALECGHAGEPTGETVPCRSCRGTVKLKVYRCAACGVSGPLTRRP